MAKFKRMDAQAKARWVEGLRSGEYKQGHKLLYDAAALLDYGETAPAYCCLGVLQKVLGFPLDDDHQPSNTLLFPACARAAGLPVPKVMGGVYGEVSDRNPQKVLAKMNSRGATFAQIADWIEENL